MAKKKTSKASRAAARVLAGSQTAKGQKAKLNPFYQDGYDKARDQAKTSFWDRPITNNLAITRKAVAMFLLACLILDVILYTMFKFGFESCYAALCFFEG
ncbi:MAG: hypothetical protein R3261_00300 [Alphaproteobacteria bacterium]|nr:hypothetical protein [Alphaproteobacteria bacterium]